MDSYDSWKLQSPYDGIAMADDCSACGGISSLEKCPKCGAQLCMECRPKCDCCEELWETCREYDFPEEG